MDAPSLAETVLGRQATGERQRLDALRKYGCIGQDEQKTAS
jgi:hypothetical protein